MDYIILLLIILSVINGLYIIRLLFKLIDALNEENKKTFIDIIDKKFN